MGWRNDINYSVEPKFDGIGISITYEKGTLVKQLQEEMDWWGSLLQRMFYKYQKYQKKLKLMPQK